MTDHTLHFTQGEAAVGAFSEYGKLQLVPSPNIVNIDMMSKLESSNLPPPIFGKYEGVSVHPCLSLTHTSTTNWEKKTTSHPLCLLLCVSLSDKNMSVQQKGDKAVRLDMVNAKS